MDGKESICPICLAPFSTSGDHKIVSLKCGHLFGSSCILQWFSPRKKANCPQCTSVSRLSDIRPIFADKIFTIDESELLADLAAERRKTNLLESEILLLKEQIGILSKLNLEPIAKNMVKEVFIHKKLLKFVPIAIRISFGVISRNNTIFAATNNCVYILDLNSIEYKVKLIFEAQMIRSIAVNDDNLVLVACEKYLFLINSRGEVLGSIKSNTEYWSVTFGPLNTAFAGDANGYVTVINLDGMLHFKFKVAECPIHSIAFMKETIFSAGVFGIYQTQVVFKNNERIDKVGFNEGVVTNGIDVNDIDAQGGNFNNTDTVDPNVDDNNGIKIKHTTKLEIDTLPVCTNMDSNCNNLLAVFRDGTNKVHHFIYGKDEILINTGISQFKRRRDKLVGDFLYYFDDKTNKSMIYDLKMGRIQFFYEMKTEVADVLINQNYTCVLCLDGIHVFH